MLDPGRPLLWSHVSRRYSESGLSSGCDGEVPEAQRNRKRRTPSNLCMPTRKKKVERTQNRTHHRQWGTESQLSFQVLELRACSVLQTEDAAACRRTSLGACLGTLDGHTRWTGGHRQPARHCRWIRCGGSEVAAHSLRRAHCSEITNQDSAAQIKPAGCVPPRFHIDTPP
jgi:hypothetical protein